MEFIKEKEDNLDDDLNQISISKECIKLCLNCERPYEDRQTCEICNGLCFEKE